MQSTLQCQTRSSSREDRIRVPFFLWSILVGEPPKKRNGRRALLGDLAKASGSEYPETSSRQGATIPVVPCVWEPLTSVQEMFRRFGMRRPGELDTPLGEFVLWLLSKPPQRMRSAKTRTARAAVCKKPFSVSTPLPKLEGPLFFGSKMTSCPMTRRVEKGHQLVV